MGSTATRNDTYTQFHTQWCTNVPALLSRRWMGGFHSFRRSNLLPRHPRALLTSHMHTRARSHSVPAAPCFQMALFQSWTQFLTSPRTNTPAQMHVQKLPVPLLSPPVHTLVHSLTHSTPLTGRVQAIHMDRKQQVVQNIKPLLAYRFNPLKKV